MTSTARKARQSHHTSYPQALLLLGGSRHLILCLLTLNLLHCTELPNATNAMPFRRLTTSTTSAGSPWEGGTVHRGEEHQLELQAHLLTHRDRHNGLSRHKPLPLDAASPSHRFPQPKGKPSSSCMKARHPLSTKGQRVNLLGHSSYCNYSGHEKP